MRFMVAAAAITVCGTAAAQCTTSTINPGAVERIRPHMSPQAVSGVLGCTPTSFPNSGGAGVWGWSVPFSEVLGGVHQVTVAFDGAGALSAFYQFYAPQQQRSNGRLRVEPSWLPYGNWWPSDGRH